MENTTETTVQVLNPVDDKKALQNKLVELAEKREALKKQMDAVYEELDSTLKALGEGAMFQAESGIVFSIKKVSGQYVTYRELEYQRTKKKDEAKGSLSQKEAKDAGFDLSYLDK